MNLYLVDRKPDTSINDYTYGDVEAVVVAARTNAEALSVVKLYVYRLSKNWPYWKNFDNTCQISQIGTTHITEPKIILTAYVPG